MLRYFYVASAFPLSAATENSTSVRRTTKLGVLICPQDADVFYVADANINKSLGIRNDASQPKI